MNKESIAPVVIPAEIIHPFEGHPYKVLDNEEMNALTESVQENGILDPLMVRPLENRDGEYEIISGHRRFRAALRAGITEIPAFIKPVSRDEAAIMLVDSNMHRERILPSEKAFAYKLKAEALNHQGRRSDLTSEQIAPKLSTEIIAEQIGASKDTVKRYIRLTNLIPALLDMMDEGKIAFSVGVELSFLDEELQQVVLDACEENDCTPSFSQAVRMHKAANEGTLDPDGICEILSEEKANQREKVTIPISKLKGKIPDSYTEKQRQDFVIKAIDYYHRHLLRQRENAR